MGSNGQREVLAPPPRRLNMSEVLSRALWIAGLRLLPAGRVARAEDAAATDQLLARLNRISHLQGEFNQRQYGEGDAVLAESSGGFKLLRPSSSAGKSGLPTASWSSPTPSTCGITTRICRPPPGTRWWATWRHRPCRYWG